MPEIPTIPPLPEREQYREAIESIDRAMTTHQLGARGVLMTYARQTPQMQEFYETARGVGHVVDRVDRSLGKALEDTKESAAAYALGSVAGMLIVRKAHSDIVFPGSIFSTLKLDVAGDSDRLHLLHTAAEEVIEIGGHGLAVIGEELEDRIDGWGEASIKGVDNQRTFRLASGVVLLTGRIVHAGKANKTAERARKIIEQNAQAEADAILGSLNASDWDSGLEGLLNGSH